MSDSTGPSTGNKASSTGMIADPNVNGPTASAASTKVSVLRGAVVVVVSAVVGGTVDGTVGATVAATVVGVATELVAGAVSTGNDVPGVTVVSDADVVDSTITAVGADPPHAPAALMTTATSTPIRIRTASHLITRRWAMGDAVRRAEFRRVPTPLNLSA